MIQGTGSNVGKSLLVAGLCRVARRRGLSVAPFKPQNMSNNAAVTVDGGEIGRAQALQALASGVLPTNEMNPVLLKPETDTGAQVVVQGKMMARAEARDYGALKPRLMAAVLESFERLKKIHDLVIVEGAGSPAEVNLRARDIANMGFACAADVPVILAGDIDRGGVIAQIVGTKAVLDPADAKMICGFLVNRFRGDVRLFDDGYVRIEQDTGWPGFGVLPFFPEAIYLPAEDALDLPLHANGYGLRIACLGLSRIANFDDLDPLAAEPEVDLTLVRPGEAIPGDAALVIIPGSKSTRGDLRFLREQGWDIDLAAHVRRGGHVLGICGGFQMLGQSVNDPQGLEGAAGEDVGLGLLDVETEMKPAKRVKNVLGKHIGTGASFSGYEIHIGETKGPDCVRPFAKVDGHADGAVASCGRIMGSYVHGMFSSDTFREAFLKRLGGESDGTAHSTRVEATLDGLAAHIETHLDVDGIFASAR